ncbi:MAG: phosphatidylserine decarboxylase [Elusimicrobia bacterium]|nr:phosphatidylserine decarboxylase [Elusimicrobiota bacterium]
MSVVKEGLFLIIIPLVLGFFFLFIIKELGIILIILALFFAYFFRDPAREIVKSRDEILSPCDGTVMEVTEDDNFKIVRVFLSVFSVHLQRSPVEGSVADVQYNPGKFLPAMDPKAHELNENNIITIDSPKGRFKVKQIAGILARRVVSWVKPKDNLAQGQKIGFIKFGSQVDLFTPKNVNLNVKVGDKVFGGKTVFGKFKND